MSICVMYVWVPGARFAEPTARFVESYDAHTAGVAHELIVLAKCEPGSPALASAPAARCIAVGEGGFDIGPFLALAPQFHRYDRLVMLGAYTRILADDWLLKLCAAGPLASATGSFEIRPHLRTSAFAVTPQLLALMPRLVVTKEQCYEFEHGERSLYRTALAHGIEGVVVDRDGATYRERDWPTSRTYRLGDQDGLLCADNQTDAYRDAVPAERERLHDAAWCYWLDPSRVPPCHA